METASASIVQRLARTLPAEVVETHISWVLLTPGFAYKIKKPVKLPFVDYSTPERRQHFCEEEVRLNRRLAPSLYLGVSRISGPPQSPAIDGPGATLDHAVRMRRFPAGALFSEQAAAGTLSADAVDRLARKIADFHLAAPPTHASLEHAADRLHQRTLAALAGCEALLAPAECEALREWIEQQSAATHALWEERRAAGFVREGHGDLHLANVLELDGDVAAFDCIEFDAALRWIDVIEDAAFPLMDFAAHDLPAFGWRFLDGWLERTGDYAALPGLRLCLVYRALVRGTVEHLRSPLAARAARYVREAIAWTQTLPPTLFITHGLPGSGKTFASQQLLQREGAVRIRSDVERKRLAGLDPLADSHAAGLDLYTPEAGERTYARLFALARSTLQAGFPVVLDAAFLRHDEREQARALAASLDLPFAIVACKAPLPVMRERLRRRQGDASEADLAVLEKLRAADEPLRSEELPLLWHAAPAA